ncbi:hypothetical protein CU669_20270 [Paramagnetospirillum kuznetsovii]|uniref:Uncharacterized protein n=1 Tax=Paramagnetospirillum kuznetsovii TaxID=2053833 RepID=A0A364NT45_9PROT|nr:hypothetical protein [Paramagnetospirillum kuznetsovii]RAU20085.1 hypothetical protein CU669_20270 [Paramagnetospirillum kuznetsovii]
MADPSILSVALANLRKSHEFLLKILNACGNVPGAPGAASDQEMMAAIAHLAHLTESVIQDGESAHESGGDFVAADIFSGTTPDTRASVTDDKMLRLQVILQICLEQSERNWLQARRLKTENAALRRGMKQIAADVVAARSVLPPMTAAAPRPTLAPAPAPAPAPITAARPSSAAIPTTVARLAGQQKLRLK